ncbi:integral membrane sensor signal transduction histidine kinase [Ruminiclostridium papyrosolvens DSM 2782]|uniref:histidine kinase n=1 Tax=Ruminiclostridium papyrosolvens DSM 2782 TaxID=588581 RepID=F1TIQ9_9FIRM|nr:ATP-binding protein [Ruminiclostridium papyrosolvens]EGD45697.1 integral membrane sensor signal transduction histidine kinase [Ruminiclostridium papyrosolvens DSM 2782]WES32927.1 ATP-binding protein [Ruminiclostridium papyrosolvens DSM 2782]
MLETLIKILIYLFSAGVHLVLLMRIKSIKYSRQLHHICALNIFILFMWTILALSNIIWDSITGHKIYFIYFLGSVCAFILPATLIILCILLVKNKISSLATYILICIPPATSTVMLVTNSFHKLFIKEISADANTMVFGSYYYVHCTWQLVYATFAVLYLVYFSLKYTNCLTKQILFVVSGIIMPIAVDYVVYLNYFSNLPISLPDSIHALSYCFTTVCLAVAIRKYRFLDTLPIAIRSIVDYISDSFVVIDYKNKILEMNKNFKREFGSIIKQNESDFSKVMSNDNFYNLKNQISQMTSKGGTHQNTKFEQEFLINNTVRYFEIEIIHVYAHEQYIAILILFHDMTEHMQVIKLMEENAKQMIEKARLVSLHNLIGGISHNMKSPLMSSSGGILALKNHTRKIENLITDMNNSGEYSEYLEIVSDMRKWEDSIKNYLVYMSDIITAVKEQAASMIGNQNRRFEVKEVFSKLELLLDFELKRSNCSLNSIINVSEDTYIEGDISSLTQILGNAVINATQAYSQGGVINLIADKKPEGILFTIQDFGKGIPTEIKDRIFNEMVTTKGKDGSGLGLYFANIAIKSQFRGSISIESEEGKGTTIYITIPIKMTN